MSETNKLIEQIRDHLLAHPEQDDCGCLAALSRLEAILGKVEGLPEKWDDEVTRLGGSVNSAAWVEQSLAAEIRAALAERGGDWMTETDKLIEEVREEP